MPWWKKSTADLSFKYEDTKILLISHAHYDHDEAAGIIKQETGAQLMVTEGDVEAVESEGSMLNAVIVGSVTVNPNYILTGNPKYPEIASDYEKPFAVLESLPVDLFFVSHGGYFNLQKKYKLREGA